jgi:hypothetical protein
MIAWVSLFVALSGTGYAASEIVNSDQRAKTAAKPLTKKTVNAQIGRFFEAKKGKLIGPSGPSGPSGPPGPTAAAVAGSSSAAPEPSFASSVDVFGNPLTTTITTSVPSRLLVFASVSASITCSAAGTCSVTYAIYLDGAPVAGSAGFFGAVASATTTRSLYLTALTPGVVSAGAHEVRVRRAASMNSGGQSISTDARVGALAIGG